MERLSTRVHKARDPVSAEPPRIDQCFCCRKLLFGHPEYWLFIVYQRRFAWNGFLRMYTKLVIPYLQSRRVLISGFVVVEISASFVAKISVKSPRKLFMFIIYKYIFRIKVSKKHFI